MFVEIDGTHAAVLCSCVPLLFVFIWVVCADYQTVTAGILSPALHGRRERERERERESERERERQQTLGSDRGRSLALTNRSLIFLFLL